MARVLPARIFELGLETRLPFVYSMRTAPFILIGTDIPRESYVRTVTDYVCGRYNLGSKLETVSVCHVMGADYLGDVRRRPQESRGELHGLEV